jgi:hypothetical protein
MDNNTFIRLAAPAAVTAAAIGIPADLYHFTIDSRASAAHTVLFKAHGLLLVVAMGLLVVALAGIAFRLGRRTGLGGHIAITTAFAGTLLALGNIATEAFAMPLAPERLDDPHGYSLVMIITSFGLYAIGWLSVAVVLARSGLVAKPAALLLAVGAVVGFTPTPGAYMLLLAGAAATTLSMARRADAADADRAAAAQAA